ncbi:SMP-30/gluconolactonase/LRE family protein [Hymenobacter sp. ASUV-10]|uniref:SMP-30/gluconolactonase/LRE family protein n=1 Tax=Hymenobacter aranciens TaxID=3063996 RepID=A0ABT9B5C0_9BACT|nr:SMP-30/gluconolactonase/LRE family protein [Hymenobacter sp. ASUV-10]MDO7873472.1 SMP-30/gluconolactonase/LRE family protein [Hymenobacter sp. ASUV-10]
MRFLLPFLLGTTLVASAQGSRSTHIGHLTWHSPAFTQLVPANAQIEVLAAGLGHLEGPLWVPDSSMLLFNDTKTQTLYRWTETRGLSKFLEKSGYTGRLPYSEEPGSNGLALDGRGNLLLCEHGDRRLARLPLAGKSGKMTVTDNFEGRRYNSPNDLLPHPNGSLYFTDPPYGLPQQERDPQRDIAVAGVYRLDPKGVVTRELSDLSRPNGLAATADGRTLYVSESDSLRPRIWAYEVKPSGQLGKGRVFFDMTTLSRRFKEQPDGLKVDRAGNVWATGFGGISVISPAGKLLGSIDTGEVIANCAWGDDGRTLYIASGAFLCRLKTNAQGVVAGR